jgi:PST family polysaccharide transporter
MLKNLNKQLTENIVSLVSLKGLEYLLALILLPYLFRVLGPERYGAIAFMQGILAYFVIVVDYGFNLTAPRDIAKAKDEVEVGKIFSSVMAAKIILCLVVTLLFFVVLPIFNLTKWLDINLFLAIYCLVIGNVVFPVWFFQGIQKMRYITFVNITARIITVILIFTLVKTKDDYLLAALFQSCTSIFAGIFALSIIFKDFAFVFKRPSWKEIRLMFHEGWSVFISTVAISFYTASNIVILGALTNNTIVGYFSGANKIIESIKGLLGPVSQAIYPHVSQMVQKSKTDTVNFLRKVLLVFGGGNLIISIFLLVFAPWIVKILLGLGYEDSILLLRIMAFIPFMVAISNVLGIQIMLPFGMQRDFSRILIISAIFNTVIVIPLTYFYAAIGTCVSIMMTETFVTITMGCILANKHIVKDSLV